MHVRNAFRKLLDTIDHKIEGKVKVINRVTGNMKTNIPRIAQKIKEAEKADILSFFKEILETDDLSQHKVPELLEIL